MDLNGAPPEITSAAPASSGIAPFPWPSAATPPDAPPAPAGPVLAVASPASVAPPGWSTARPVFPAPVPAAPVPAAPAFPAQAVPALALVGAAGAQSPAEAALRWRLCAARIDNIIVYGVYFLFCLGAHLSPIAPGSLIVLALLSVVYHFLFEAHSGQTIGKRRYGIQVRDVDGGPAEPKAIALRSALRIVDQLPIFYLSGLVSMVRTGPHRRQRIGDVVGRTTVVAIGGRAVTRGTPSWYLPLATATALVLSVLGVLGTVNARTAPLSPLQRTQFLNGCEAASPTLDCECLLSQLQASGYSSLDRLQGLFREQEQATAAGRPASGPPDLLGALRVCRP